MAQIKKFEDGTPNGVACPECGAELMDTHPNNVLMSYPPKLRVKCSECAFEGYRMT
jgi:ribosomal protein S27E